MVENVTHSQNAKLFFLPRNPTQKEGVAMSSHEGFIASSIYKNVISPKNTAYEKRKTKHREGGTSHDDQ